MFAVEEVYLLDAHTIEVWPFLDRVLEIVRLFRDTAIVRIRIVGTIAAGEPIEAFGAEAESIKVRRPDRGVRRHPAFHALQCYLCPSLLSISNDAFEVARVITPLLVGLKLSGKVDIDLDPWLFAGIALMVERMGVAGFCAGYERDQPEMPEQSTPTPQQPKARQARGSRRRPKK